METLFVSDHSFAGWQECSDRFGFVPDPMILRAGEIFLNGLQGAAALQRSEWDVWRALEDNLGGIVEFFDMVLTRDRIPLINYRDTYDEMTTPTPIDHLLHNRVCYVKIEYNVYNAIKKGALSSLADIELASMSRLCRPVITEIDAFRYDWKPQLDVPGADATLDPVRNKFGGLAGVELTIAQFLLGGLIFSGYAQASNTTHYIQSKRSRLFLGLTAAADKALSLGNQEENQIFKTAEERLQGSKAVVRVIEPIPPILPYVVAQRPEPTNVQELLDRVLTFRESKQGTAFIDFVNNIRADGIEGSAQKA